MSRALDDLAAALLAVAPLAGAAGRPRVAAGREDAVGPLQDVLDRLATALGAPPVEVVASAEGLWSTDLAVGHRLGLGEVAPDAGALAASGDGELAAVADRARRSVPEAVACRSADGAPVVAYAAGPGDAPPVVVVTACGMPAGLVGPWLDALAPSHRVVTWETRGLFGDDGGFGQRGHDVAAQAADLVAVLDRFDLREAHVLALCGGAPIALAAAGSARIASMSLWFGDYELGGEAPKTQHQHDVEAMLAMAGRDRATAAGLHRLFRSPATLAKLPARLAHHLLYPYATPELLHRYGLLNGSIMTTDCRPFLAGVTQPTLVVTSAADTTAHPAGSAYVAEHLADARLEVLPEGDHLSAFGAAAPLVELADRFLAVGAGR